MDKPVSSGVLVLMLLSVKPYTNTKTLALPLQGGRTDQFKSSAWKMGVSVAAS